MVKIYVMDNGGQWTHREWRVLRELGVETEIKRNDVPLSAIEDADGLVLSGGAATIEYESFKLGKTSEYLEKLEIPILGICAGAQFMGLYYGGKVGRAETPGFGKVKISILESDHIFKDLPNEIIAWESHNDEIKELPHGFELLASSENCKVEAFYNDKLKRYAVQFHPEVEHTQYGRKIFENFISLCEP